jgi:hypothetical protein
VNNPDRISESLETIFWVKILKFFDADPGSGMEKFGSGIEKLWIRDPGYGLYGTDKIQTQIFPCITGCNDKLLFSY